MLSSDASASIEINPVHHCTPYDQQLPVSPYPCKGLQQDEVRAERASKDAGRGASASSFEARRVRAEHLRMGETETRSAQLDIRFLDDLAPQVHLAFDVGPKVFD